MLGPMSIGALSSGAVEAASTLLTGLVNVWKLDESSAGAGAVTRVDSRNDNDLTDINTVASGTGFGGLTAADFNAATSEYLRVAHSNSLSVGGGRSWTVAIWTNPETLGSRVLVSKSGASGGDREFELDYIASSTNRFMATVDDGGAANKAITASTPTITAGNDYLVILWYDASVKTGYIQVNNDTVYSTAFTNGPNRTAANWGIGSWGGGGGAYWDGLGAHCYRWNRILTEAERTELYNGGAPLELNPSKIFTRVSSQELYSDAGTEDWLGRPTLLDDGSKWIMVYRQGSTHSAGSTAVFHIRFSEDEGATWTAADTFTDESAVTNFPVEGSGSFGAMNAALIQAPNGDLLLLVLEQNGGSGGTRQWRSTDGGASWTDEGTINSDTTLKGPRDYVIIGTDIYIACWVDPGSDNTEPYQSVLYKSTDNGATWAKVSDITSTVEDTNEVGIEHLGDGKLITVLKGGGGAYTRVSTDYGVTWGALTGKAVWISNFGAPRLKLLGGVLYLFGRSSNSQTAIVYSQDEGVTWSNIYNPDESTYDDAGYCDILQRANGDWYMLSYGGTLSAASVYEYVFTLDVS